MKPRDIAALVTLGAPTLAPNGRTAVVAATSPDLDADEYRSALWIVDVAGNTPPRQLTHGEHDTAPRYSPDGSWLAFLRNDEKSRPQLCLLPTACGDARMLTELPGGAGAPVWSPDSTRIAFSARVPDDGRYGTDDKIPPDKEPPRRITGLQYRRDNVGFLVDHVEQVFVLELTGEPHQVTAERVDSSSVTWSPDGSTLAFLSARQPTDDTLYNDVFVVRPDGTELRRVTDTSLSIEQVLFSADGAQLLLLAEDYGPDGTQWVGAQTGLFAVDAAAGGRPHRITDAERYHLNGAEAVLHNDRVLVPNENRGTVELLSVHSDGGVPVVSSGPRAINGIAAAADTIVVSYADASSSGELGVLRNGDVHRLTDFAAKLPAPPRPLVELTAAGPDGQQLHGFLVLPAGDGPHPVLLMIHGGPFAQYTHAVFDEAQVYAGAGYAVVYTNPRGSSGYGSAYGRHILHDVGAKSSVDLLALLDSALVRPELDDSRVGVLGGSHGGFMTSWLIGHTDRFKAAVSERAVNAIDSFTGSSDIGWGFADALYGPDLDRQHAQSPLTYADQISTPLLIIHSEHDWRCPVEQAQRLFVALKRRAAEVEMLLFPGEGHEMSRSGIPSHRVARFDAILDWFARYLG